MLRETKNMMRRLVITGKKKMVQETKKSLPIYPFKVDLVIAISKHQFLIVEGESSCGKTTQIPQYLHEAGFTRNGKKIACIQPNRVEARAAAAYVAEEMGVKLGEEVGYNTLLEGCASEQTVIQYMTDDRLLDESRLDAHLSSYSVIIIDDSHERTLHQDKLLGLVKNIAHLRPDLKWIISSTTALCPTRDSMMHHEFSSEPDLGTHSVMIIDEARQRPQQLSKLFRLMKKIVRLPPYLKSFISSYVVLRSTTVLMQHRKFLSEPDLRLHVKACFSATLDLGMLSDYLDGATIFRIPGRRLTMESSTRFKTNQINFMETSTGSTLGKSENTEINCRNLMANRTSYANTCRELVMELYELLPDERIVFIKALRLEGTNIYMRQPNITESAKKKMSNETKKSLPIYLLKEELIMAIRQNQIIIIQGAAGCGKTTQIPQYLHEAGFISNGKKLGCTLPNRVEAMAAAVYVAEEMGVKLGNEVGYSTCFKDCTSERTVIKYMTDNVLLNELQSDTNLSSYCVIMIDEAHKRKLQTDIVLGMIKKIALSRTNLKLIISTSMLFAEKISSFFDGIPIFDIPERRYMVDVFYTKEPVPDYIEACVKSVMQIHATQPLGDILAFLAGEEEIEVCREMLQDRIKQLSSMLKKMFILPMHANLPLNILKKNFEPTPPNTRKVVLATSIAETSLTIDNIIYVIDSGFEIQKNFNSLTGLEMLMHVAISKACAIQRASRAGRVVPGKCFRLYPAEVYKNELKEHTVPEIQRINLNNVVLMLIASGNDNLLHFDYLDPPPQKALELALTQLYALGALNSQGKLTKLGRRMAQFPVESMMAKMVLTSEKFNCSEEIVTIAAMLLVNGAIFSQPKDKIRDADNARKNVNHLDGDHFTLMKVYNQWTESDYSEQWCSKNYIQFRSMERARDIREKLVELMKKVGIIMVSVLPDTNNIRKAITVGYFCHAARLSKGENYKTIKSDESVVIQPSSVMFAKQPHLVLYHELVFTTRKIMRFVIEVGPMELLDVAPHYYSPREFLKFGRANSQEVAIHEFVRLH